MVVEYQQTVCGDAKAKQVGAEDMDEADMEMLGIEPAEKKSETEEEGGTLELFEKYESTRGVFDDKDELGSVFNQSTEDERSSKASIRLLKVKDIVPFCVPGMDFGIKYCPKNLLKRS